jgi:branched-chain amino acid transport system permease protein
MLAALLGLVGALVLSVVALPAAAGAATEPDAAGGGATCERFTKADARERVGGDLGTSVWGRLCQEVEGVPVYPEGVAITVSQDGNEVASGTTDDIGFFHIELPEPGSYEVVLDPETLPDGVTLAAEGSEALTPTVRADSRLVFRLGEGSSEGAGAERYATAAAKGLRLGLILAVAAVGLSMVFGVVGLVNFSHAELVTFGAIAAYVLDQAGLPFWLAVVLAVPLGAGFGWTTDRTIWRPLRARQMALLSMMVVSIGLGTALRSVFQVWFGTTTERYTASSGQVQQAYGPFRLTDNDLLVMAICVVVLLGVTFMLQRTRTGTAIRAVADNPDLAESSGIAVNRVIAVVWLWCGGLAALGGILYGLTVAVQYDVGFLLLLSMFAAVVLGGLGNAYGAIFGAIVIGVVQETSALAVDPAYKFVVALVVLIVVLLVRPTGIFGRTERFG